MERQITQMEFECRLRRDMGNLVGGAENEDRAESPPGMCVGFNRDLGNMDMCRTRLFAIPKGAYVELGESSYVPYKTWNEVATKEAWEWYDRIGAIAAQVSV